MYSVVLMMALSSGGETPDCHGRGRGHGCAGCYGGCYGGGCYGGGCYGGGCYGGGCYGGGCYGGNVSYGCCGCYGGAVIEKKNSGGDEDQTMRPAKVTVNLPAKAKLTINGTATKKSDQTRRVFVSPKLRSGRSFVYNLRAEFEVDGKTEVVQKRVVFRAGSDVTVSLKAPETSVARR